MKKGSLLRVILIYRTEKSYHLYGYSITINLAYHEFQLQLFPNLTQDSLVHLTLENEIVHFNKTVTLASYKILSLE